MSEERLSQAFGTRTVSNGETGTPGFLKEVTDGRRDQKQNPRAAGPTPDHVNCNAKARWLPQTTTVGYVNDGLTLYFLCGLDSQKAANLARDDRVSVTIDHDTSQVMEITGLSMAAHAQPVLDPAEANKVSRMLPLKYPEQVNLPGPMPTVELVRVFRVTPTVISLLDYSKGFGRTDLVTC
jgi:Pyridoxamine 5'-phosphate oxidase